MVSGKVILAVVWREEAGNSEASEGIVKRNYSGLGQMEAAGMERLVKRCSKSKMEKQFGDDRMWEVRE